MTIDLSTITDVPTADAAMNRAIAASRTTEMLLDSMDVRSMLEEFNARPGTLDKYVTVTISSNAYQNKRVRDMAAATEKFYLPDEPLTIANVGQMMSIYTRQPYTDISVEPAMPSVDLSQGLTRLMRLILNATNVSTETDELRHRYGVLAKNDLQACDGLLVHVYTSRRDATGYMRVTKRSKSSFALETDPMLHRGRSYSRYRSTGLFEPHDPMKVFEPQWQWFNRSGSEFGDIPEPQTERFNTSTTEVQVLGSHAHSDLIRASMRDLAGHWNKAKQEYADDLGANATLIGSHPTEWDAVTSVKNAVTAARKILDGDSDHAVELRVSHWKKVIAPVFRDSVGHELFLALVRGKAETEYLDDKGFDPDTVAKLKAIPEESVGDNSAVNFLRQYLDDNHVQPYYL